jgi:OmpA-OmpF porin, OOP family
MPSADQDHAALRFFTDVWPLIALGLIGAVVVRACVPVHPAAALTAGSAPPVDAPASVHAGRSHAMVALSALTPESSSEQVLEALNLTTVDFGAGSSALPDDADLVLIQVAGVIAARPASERFEISGRADGAGSPLSDLDLSRRRAQAVVDFLVNQGIDAQRLQAQGLGDLDPVGNDTGPQARFPNRHLEFKYLP